MLQNENTEKVTVDTILDWLTEQVREKRPIPPELYLDISIKLNLLKSDENDKLIELRHALAVKRANYVNEGGTSAAANIRLEADPLYMDVKKQEARLKTIDEAIKQGKLYARIKNDEMNSSRFGQV